MKVTITISKDELKKLVLDHISDKVTNAGFDKNKVKIEVKSTQNYRAEWESADFRAVYEAEL